MVAPLPLVFIWPYPGKLGPINLTTTGLWGCTVPYDCTPLPVVPGRSILVHQPWGRLSL